MRRAEIDGSSCCACGSPINHFPSSRSCAIGTLCFSCFYEIAQRCDRSELAHYGIRTEALDTLRDDQGELLPIEELRDLGRLLISDELLGQLLNSRDDHPGPDGDHRRDRPRRRGPPSISDGKDL